MLDFHIFGLEFQNIIAYLKSVSSNLSSCKVWCKHKNLQIWVYKCLIWVFVDLKLKTILPYLKSAPSKFV